MKRSTHAFAITALAASLAACGGGGGSGSGSTGSVSFNMTDAPTMEFSSVTIAFTGLRLKPADGDWVDFTFDTPKTLDLLTLQGGVTEPLITDEEVPAGNYTEARLMIDTSASYVVVSGEPDVQKTLAVPSGEQSGLKLKGGFTVAADQSTDFTIDFDARKSIVNPQGKSIGDYLLKPVLRLVSTDNTGSLSGQVDYATISTTRMNDAGLADCADPSTTGYYGAVYIYQGADVEPTDLNINSDTNPLVVAPVEDEDNDGIYTYSAAFLTAGDYTVSYTCQLDDNETTETGVEFDGTQNVTVNAGENTEAAPIPLVP
ncbi:DUF4382 domain-containing protein [Marinobacter sp. C2H3]|uniref:DUF4382 domain-containing protein n=1 Tax=Marinobacter sp. C2H3 TaxID=3119003 RepID=UPI00300EF4F9